MKKILSVFLLTLSFYVATAQSDEHFYQPTKELKPIEFSNTEEITLSVANDTITAILLKPKSKPKATILFFHGTGGNVSTYQFMVSSLVEDQFQVVMVDFRGYGKSTGKPTHLNIAEDGQVFFDDMLKREDIKNTPIILYGASMGSQIATLLAKNNQNRIKALILDGALSSFTDIAAFYAPEYKEIIEKSYVSSYSAKENIKPLNAIKKLFIHSKEDKEIPYDQGMMVFNNAPEPKQFLEYEGAHLMAIVQDKEQVLKAINNLLK